MSDKIILIATALSLSAVGVLMYLFLSGTGTIPARGQKDKPPQSMTIQDSSRVSSAGTRCGVFHKTCTDKIRSYTPGCDEVIGRRRVKELLRTPMRTRACLKLAKHLDDYCPSGCIVNESELVMIPGDINVLFPATPDPDGSCVVRAERPVTVNATCYVSSKSSR